MKVSVTQDDVKNGIACSSGACPVALALKRATGAQTVSVGISTARADKLLMLNLPDEATDFIGRFDDGMPVDPFEFDFRGEIYG